MLRLLNHPSPSSSVLKQVEVNYEEFMELVERERVVASEKGEVSQRQPGQISFKLPSWWR